MKADESGSDMLRPSVTEDEPCSSVLDRLKTLDEVGRKSEQDAVAIVQSRQDYAIISDWNTAVGTCRRMARSWRKTAKHRDAVRWT